MIQADPIFDLDPFSPLKLFPGCLLPVFLTDYSPAAPFRRAMSCPPIPE
jgi:hypothetical protein